MPDLSAQVMQVLTPTNEVVDPDNPPIGIVKYVRRIPHAEILTLNLRDPVIAPTPPQDRALVYIRGLFIANLPDGNYTNVDGAAYLVVGDDYNGYTMSVQIAGYIVGSGAPYSWTLLPQYLEIDGGIAQGQTMPRNSLVAVGLDAHMNNGASGALTGGGPNNYLEFQIWVEVIAVP